MKYTFERKLGRKWVNTYETTNEADIYDRLAHELIAKKLHACTYISRITDRNNYDGTRTIVVTYSNYGATYGRGTYIVKA